MEFSNKLYYTNETGSFSLINGDTFKELKKFSNKRFDMIFADPPYFLSNDGITCSGGKMVSVNKGDTLNSKKHTLNFIVYVNVFVGYYNLFNYSFTYIF